MSFNIDQNRKIVNAKKKKYRLTQNTDRTFIRNFAAILNDYHDEIEEEKFKLVDLSTLYAVIENLDEKEKICEQLMIHNEYNDLVKFSLVNKYSLFAPTRFHSEWRFDKPFRTFFNSNFFIPSIKKIVDMSLSGDLSIGDTYGAMVTYYEFYLDNLGRSAMSRIFGRRRIPNLPIEYIASAIPEIGIKLPPDRSLTDVYSKQYSDGTYYAVNTVNKLHTFVSLDLLGACDHIYCKSGLYIRPNIVADSRIKYVLSTLGLRNCVIEGYYGLRSTDTNEYIPFDSTYSPSMEYSKLMKMSDNYPVLEIFDIHQSDTIGTSDEPPYIDRYNWIKTYLEGIKCKRYKMANIKQIKNKKTFDNATCVVGDNSFVTPILNNENEV